MKKRIRFLSVILAVLLLLSAVPVVAAAEEFSQTDSFLLNVDSDGDSVEFVPEKDGWYSFYTEGEYDTYGFLYNSEGEEIAYSDDTAESLNLHLKVFLEAGETYCVEVYMYYGEEESVVPMYLYVEEAVSAVDATILYEPEEKVCVRGAEYDTANLDDLVIEFKLSDGTVERWDYYHDDSVAGSFVYWDFLCDENDDIIEKDGKVTLRIECDEAFVDIEFTLLDNPVESFEIDADSFVFYENCGDGVWDEVEGVYYYWYEFDEDDTVTIHYKDGTTVTDKAKFFADDYGCGVKLYDTQMFDPWVVGEDNYVYAEYMGYEVEISVEILPVPVESMELTKLPDMVEYEDCYKPLWQGAEITLTLKDGTTVTETIDEGDLVYDAYLDFYTLDVRGYEVVIEYWGDVYEISCFNLVQEVDGFTYTEHRATSDMNVVKASRTGEGTIIEVEYEDGGQETFAFDVVDYWDLTDMVFGRIKTAHGYLDYSIEPVYDEEDIFAGYDIWFLDDYVFADLDTLLPEPDDELCILGDADESGTVNIKDATAIQKHIAGIIELTKVGEEVADADLSGDVNIKDATAIQKWIAGIETGLPIGGVVNLD